jgi:hypothetical protein
MSNNKQSSIEMTDPLKEILAEFENLKGQFIITQSWEVERLVAIGEDEQDYYYITYNGRKLTWNTCVGRVIPLKGYLRDTDYAEFIRLAKLNHFDQATVWGNRNPEEADAFNQNHIAELLTIGETDFFLTPVCFELN